MLTSILLPLIGLLSIYYTFYTLIQYIQNPFLLFLSTTLTIFLPYPSYQNFKAQPLLSMLTSILLPPIGLLSIYYTFYTLIQYIQNPFLLFLSTTLTIFLQVVFIDQILPYNSQFNTKYLLFQYIYPLWQSYYTN